MMQERGRQKKTEPEKSWKKSFWDKGDVVSAVQWKPALGVSGELNE